LEHAAFEVEDLGQQLGLLVHAYNDNKLHDRAKIQGRRDLGTGNQNASFVLGWDFDVFTVSWARPSAKAPATESYLFDFESIKTCNS